MPRARGRFIDGSNTLSLLSLVSLITTLHDRYYPILMTRSAADQAKVT